MIHHEPIAPAYATRRERRDAERAAAVMPPPVPAAAAVPQQFPAAVVPPVLVARPAQHSHRARTGARPSAAPRRRGRTVAKSIISATAMFSAVGLTIGLSVPAAATFRSPDVPDAANAAMSASPAALQPVTAPARPGQQLDFALSSAGADLAAAVATVRAETTFNGESKAEALRAVYLAAGRPFEPGFIPTSGAVRWPYPESVEVSSGFGERWGGFHGGTDFVPGYGTPVGAIADGVITWVGRDWTNFGYYVTIAHVIDGVRVDSLYAHLVDDSSAQYEIYPGKPIKVGELIGDTGNTGFSTGPHLHLEIRLDGVQVNPFEWLTINAR